MRQMISDERLTEFEHIIAYSFRQRRWLRQALTHSSYSREQKKTPDYAQEGNKGNKCKDIKELWQRNKTIRYRI